MIGLEELATAAGEAGGVGEAAHLVAEGGVFFVFPYFPQRFLFDVAHLVVADPLRLALEVDGVVAHQLQAGGHNAAGVVVLYLGTFGSPR